MPRTCKQADCGRPSHARGHCSTHYDRLMAGKDVRAPVRTRRARGEILARDPLGRRRCLECLEWLPLAAYGRAKASADGLHVKCKPCVSLLARVRRYGMDVPTLHAMIADQGGMCAIGLSHPLGDNYTIDHDHSCCPYSKNQRTCGRCTRGLLCNHCNLMLGLAGDSVERLHSAAEYLKKGTMI